MVKALHKLLYIQYTYSSTAAAVKISYEFTLIASIYILLKVVRPINTIWWKRHE